MATVSISISKISIDVYGHSVFFPVPLVYKYCHMCQTSAVN